MDVPPAWTSVTRVGIGLIERDRCLLVRRRPPGQPLAGSWEFPGGKCRPGETPRDAAERECLEELGRAVVLGNRRNSMTFTYPHGTVELHFFDGRLREPSADPEPDTGFVWVPVEALATLPFPEANRDVVASLVETSRSIATSRDASEARPADR